MTPRVAAAFKFLQENNVYYKYFLEQQRIRLAAKSILTISSFDLFINLHGIECAIRPYLYPTTDFTDTDIRNNYQTASGDYTRRVVSIGLSWTRKVLSSARAYGEERDLTFFMYEKSTAQKFFNANVRAQKLGVTADVLARDSQASAGYWEIVRDALADLVRIMMHRCYGSVNHKQLYDHVRNLRGEEVWLCAVPNLFITIAPAEWTFPRPYFLEPYKNYLTGCAYIMALHMYYLVRSIWGLLSNLFGHRFSSFWSMR